MRFEDLEAWKEARALTKDVYALTRSSALCRDQRFCSQVQSAAVSVLSNLAEGFERAGNQEKLHFYNIARASCGELRSQLYVIEDVYQDCAQGALKLRGRVEAVGRLVTGLIASTRRRATRAGGDRR